MPTSPDSESKSNSAGNEVSNPPRKRGLLTVLKFVLFGLVALLAVVSALIALQPSDFRVARSANMSAPPEAVFAQLNDFHNWDAWSPWAKLDPDAKSTYEGPTSGEGSIFHWDGDSNVGAGSMTILDSQPNEMVHIKLDFIRPLEGTSDVYFTLKPEGDQTNVTWSMEGKNGFMGKAISLVIDCDKMMNEQFDKGLASIKSIVESQSAE